MATGACGINCDVCKLNIIGACATCGPGKSDMASSKLTAQRRLFGAGCPILECANMNRINFCMSDCPQFPCENFSSGPYPFSQGFLAMQKRRLNENQEPADVGKIIVPIEYWDSFVARDKLTVCNFTLAAPHEKGVVFPFLNKEVLIDTQNKSLMERIGNEWLKIEDPLMELVTLVYFNRVNALYPKGKELVGAKDLREAHFFKGPHEFDLKPLLDRFKDDFAGFRKTAALLYGKAVAMADMAYVFEPFPRIPIYYLFWKEDKEFNAGIDVLFDRSIEMALDAAAIWGLVNCVTRYILTAGALKCA